LKDVIDKIPGPVVSADADADLFFLGQGKILADALGNRSTYHLFQSADGAGQHAGVGSFVSLSYTVHFLADCFKSRQLSSEL